MATWMPTDVMHAVIAATVCIAAALHPHQREKHSAKPKFLGFNGHFRWSHES